MTGIDDMRVDGWPGVSPAVRVKLHEDRLAVHVNSFLPPSALCLPMLSSRVTRLGTAAISHLSPRVMTAIH